MTGVGLLAAVLLLEPGLALAAEFCPPPSPPPGAGFPPGGRVFHGPVTVQSLQLGRSAPIPCSMPRFGGDPGQAAQARCGPYRLRYSPWDPYPSLLTVLITASAQGAGPAWQGTGRGRSVAWIRCDPPGLVVTTLGERTLRVRTTRNLLVELPNPWSPLLIRESFESSYPLVPVGGPES